MWYKKPCLEQLVKAKLLKITKNYLNYNVCRIKDENANNIYDLLGITKGVFKITRQLDLDCEKMELVERCYKLQPNFSLQDWNDLLTDIGENRTLNLFISVCEKTDTTIKRLREYLQSCYDNQCIEKSSALSIFSDYYKMAKEIGFNISDNSIKFPSSLKKEHDKASFAYKVVEDEIKKKKFIENSIINKKYEFENSVFKVIIPSTPDDVIREGQLQKHCVASYVTRIENGETCICFIRKKDDIDTPFYTCEIYQGSLFQVKGFCNKYPDRKKDRELIDFIDSWIAAKNLTQEYMFH